LRNLLLPDISCRLILLVSHGFEIQLLIALSKFLWDLTFPCLSVPLSPVKDRAHAHLINKPASIIGIILSRKVKEMKYLTNLLLYGLPFGQFWSILTLDSYPLRNVSMEVQDSKEDIMHTWIYSRLFWTQAYVLGSSWSQALNFFAHLFSKEGIQFIATAFEVGVDIEVNAPD